MILSFRLSDGRQLTVNRWLAPSPSRQWIVFLPGSGAEIWDLGPQERKALLKPFGKVVPNILVVNKPGVSATGKVNERIFEKSFRRQIRLRDYGQVLRRLIPARDKILLLGFSEGAYLAPEVALNDGRVKALALISGGTRSWLDEEVYKLGGRALRRIEKVYARPNRTVAEWHGLSNATWISYDTNSTAEALNELRVPLLAIFGGRDHMIDVDSAVGDIKALARSRPQPTLLRVFPTVDHMLGRQWMTALKMAGNFLNKFSS